MSTPRPPARYCVARNCRATPHYATIGEFGNPVCACALHLGHACASGIIRADDDVTIVRLGDGARVDFGVVVAWYRSRAKSARQQEQK